MSAPGVVARRVAMAAVAALSLAVVAGCGSTSGPHATFPPASQGPSLGVTAAVAQTRAVVADALAAQKLVLRDVETPYRPAETALLAAAPRAVYQVVLQQSPDKGFIVIYELRDAGQATTAAQDQANYLATGPGRVQWPLGTHHVIRVVGTTVVLYDWLPGAVTDPGAPGIETALQTVGVDYPVPG